jgi:GntR family transcriptional regulator
LLANREGASIEILKDYANVPLPPLDLAVGNASHSYRHLRRRHWRNGHPYLLADIYIDAQLAKRLDESEFTTKTALRLAASIPRVKIVAAHQILTVGSADIETAAQLDLQLNAPICFVDRYAVDQRDRLVLVAKGIYRGDTIRMDLKLK